MQIFAHLKSHHITLRKSAYLKIILVAFGVVLIAQQVFNYVYIKRLDRKYSDIITDKLEILRSFALVSNQSASLERAMVHLIRYNGKDYDSVTKQIGYGSSNINNLLSKMKQHAVSADENASIDSLGSLFSTYMAKCNSDLVIMKSKQVDSAAATSIIGELREVYTDFTSKQLKEITHFIGNGEKVSDEISANTSKTSAFLLFIGILPFIVMSMMLVLAALTLFVLGYSVNWFRNME